MTKKREFPLVVSNGERGVKQTAVTVKCCRCPDEVTYTNISFDGQVVRKLKQDRWWIGKSREADLCPVCAGLPSSEERAMKPVRPVPVNAPRSIERRPVLSLSDHRAKAEQLFAPKPQKPVEVETVEVPQQQQPTPVPPSAPAAQAQPVGTPVDNTTLELILVALDELRNESEVRNKVIHTIVEGQKQQKAATEQLINAVAQIVPALVRSNDALFGRMDRFISRMDDVLDHLKTSTAPAPAASEPDVVVPTERLFNYKAEKEEEDLPIQEAPFVRADMNDPSKTVFLNPDLFIPPPPEPDPEPTTVPASSLGHLLTAMRVKSGISPYDLARKLDVSRQTISNYETDKTVPPRYRIDALAKIFGLDYDRDIAPHLTERRRELDATPFDHRLVVDQRRDAWIADDKGELLIKPTAADMEKKGGAPCLISRGPGGYGSNIRIDLKIWTQAGLSPDKSVRVEMDEEDGTTIKILPATDGLSDCIPRANTKSVTIRPSRINLAEERIYPVIKGIPGGGLELYAQ